MSLIKYNALANDYVPTTFGNLIDRFFSDVVTRNGGAAYSFVPKVDVIETEKAFELHLAVPGMNKEDFKIDVKDNFLSISGERKFTREKKEGGFQSIETQYGTFSRSFALPENVKIDSIEAKYNNGILELVIPKDEKKTLKASIKVN